jgi:RNA polymerase sigma-70 factor (ECF subfamily)
MTQKSVSPSAADEQALCARIVERDEGALAVVYDRSVAAVFATALGVTRDIDLSEDITQAAFLDLWNRPERYLPSRGPLRPWLATVAHLAAVDCVRCGVDTTNRGFRSSRVPMAVVPDFDEVAPAVVISERVRQALDELPDEQSVPIRLTMRTGHGYREIAKVLGVAESTVKARIRAGLRRISEVLHASDAA